MKVLVIGGNGYVGKAVVRRLGAAGHSAVVMVRNAADALGGVESRVGDLLDRDSLRAAITPDIEAVVHAATPTGDWDADRAALEELTRLLVGRALVYLSGVWVLGDAPVGVDESAATSPIEIVQGLAPGDQVILSDTSAWNDYERIRLD